MEDLVGEVVEIKETGNPVIEYYNSEKEEYFTRHISQDVIPFKIQLGMKVHFQCKLIDEKPVLYFEKYQEPEKEKIMS